MLAPDGTRGGPRAIFRLRKPMNFRRILCVHNGPNLAGLRGTLEQQGYEVVPAKDGAKALDVLSKQEVDGVIMDYDLAAPGGTLRNCIRHQCPDMPMLLVRSVEELRTLPLRVFGAYLTTPEAPDAVFAHLKKLVSRPRSRLERHANSDLRRERDSDGRSRPEEVS
jgi:DNA-binding response OmpR family regulator